MIYFIVFIASVLFCYWLSKNREILKDKYLDELYKKRELLRVAYDIDPSEENKNELKKINREIDNHLYTDG